MQATAAIALLLMSTVTQPALAQAGTPARPQLRRRPSPHRRRQSPTTPRVGRRRLRPVPTRICRHPRAQADRAALSARLRARTTRTCSRFFPNPLKPYTPTTYPAPRLGNTPRLDSLLRDGKIYLSLSDAVLLALENNFDIADRAHQPGHRRHRHPARQGRRYPARRFHWPGHRHARRLDHDHHRRRRPGRHLERRGGGGTGASGLVSQHQRRRPAAGESRPLAHRQPAVRGDHHAAVQHLYHRHQPAQDRYQHVQLRLHAGLSDRHAFSAHLQQLSGRRPTAPVQDYSPQLSSSLPASRRRSTCCRASGRASTAASSSRRKTTAASPTPPSASSSSTPSTRSRTSTGAWSARTKTSRPRNARWRSPRSSPRTTAGSFRSARSPRSTS